jgi:hypothetical protein
MFDLFQRQRKLVKHIYKEIEEGMLSKFMS